MEQFLLEGANAKLAFAPVDLNTAAVTGARVSLADARRVAVVIQVGTSTSGVLDITLKQHDAASAGNSKVLAVANKYFTKWGASTSFTKVEPTDAESNYVMSSSHDAGGIVVFEVLAEDLDRDNGFTHFSVDIADSTAAKLGCGLYLVNAVDFKPAFESVL
jgi:hypothetical protein